jgi:hypothetical protein
METEHLACLVLQDTECRHVGPFFRRERSDSLQKKNTAHLFTDRPTTLRLVTDQ